MVTSLKGGHSSGGSGRCDECGSGGEPKSQESKIKPERLRIREGASERERERETSQKLSKAVWHSRATGRSICELDVSAIRM